MKIAENTLPNYSKINKIFNGYIETKGEVIMDENNNAYMEVNDEKYKSIDDIKDLLESVFTTEYIDKKYNKIFESEYSYFKEIKDNFYVLINSGMIKPPSEDLIEKIALLENNF